MTTRLSIYCFSLVMSVCLHARSAKAENPVAEEPEKADAADQATEVPPSATEEPGSPADSPPPPADPETNPPATEGDDSPPASAAALEAKSPVSTPVPGAMPPQMEPLPPPPPPVDPKYIAKGPWRGRFWLGLRLLVTGPIGGERPARATVVAVSGGLDFGWRISNWLGLGTGISGQLHDSDAVLVSSFYGDTLSRYYGDLFAWDIAFLRFFVPLQKRFQPFVDVGGGLSSYTRPTGGALIGGHLRSGIGFEGWVGRNITLGLGVYYRLTALEQRWEDGGRTYPLGHSLQGAVELGFHW